MRKKTVLVLLACLVSLGMVASVACGTGPSVINPDTTQVRFDLSVVITDGNHSWIPINKDDRVGNQASLILKIIRAFEDEHPELEVTNWKIQERVADTLIEGIWVDHRPKSK